MGTQQILLIVLSVIIVGAAIAVGITMFNNQAFISNKNGLAADAQMFGTQIIQYYKTPKSQGGNGRVVSDMTAVKIAEFIGWNGTTGTGENTVLNGTTSTENGKFKIITAGADDIVIHGLGNEKKGDNYPLIETTITLSTGTIKSVIEEGL